MNQEELATFYNNLASIINVSPELATNLVKNYNTGDLAFFQTYFDALPKLSYSKNNTKNISANETVIVKDENAGKGLFGVIAKNRNNPFVYKKIEDKSLPSGRLGYLKSIFKEVIVQTLLQSDTTYGTNICHIYKLYRSANNCIMKLEILHITLKDAILASKNSFRKEPNAASSLLRDILVKIFEILDHFYKKYEFRHYDLHVSNVMSDSHGDIVENLKIIDFGLSYVKIDEQEIGVLGSNFNDCYNISFYMHHYCGNIITKSLNDLLEKIIEYPDETPPSDYLKELKEAKITNNTKGGKRKTKRKSRQVP